MVAVYRADEADARIKELEAEIERLRNFERGALQQIEDMEGEIERFRHEWAVACAALGEAKAEIERLRTILSDWGSDKVIDICELRSENERLRVAVANVLTGINHVALYKADNWPEPGMDPMVALEQIGAGQSYDLWCCWSAGMRVRRDLEQAREK